MGFCKPMSEEVPLINTKTISKEELDAQRENAAKVQAVLQSRYTDKPLACVSPTAANECGGQRTY